VNKSRSCCFLGEQTLVIGYDDGKIRLWILTKTEQTRARVLSGHFKLSCTGETGNPHPVRCICALPIASTNLVQNTVPVKLFATGSDDGEFSCRPYF
jgi:hypothetical protein